MLSSNNLLICFYLFYILQADYLSASELSDVKGKLTDDLPELPPIDAPIQPPPAKKQKKGSYSLASFIGSAKPAAVDATAAQPALSPMEKARKELDRYLSSSSIPSFDPDTGDENTPLDWWRAHHKEYPHLADMARKYLCIQASSSPSERLFSKAGNIITPRRAQLKPQKANMLIFLADNLN